MIIRTAILASITAMMLSGAALAGNSAEFVVSGSGNAITSSQSGRFNNTQAVISGDGNFFSNRQRGAHNTFGGGAPGNFNEIHNRQTRF